jgi:hypothetical protein
VSYALASIPYCSSTPPTEHLQRKLHHRFRARLPQHGSEEPDVNHVVFADVLCWDGLKHVEVVEVHIRWQPFRTRDEVFGNIEGIDCSGRKLGAQLDWPNSRLSAPLSRLREVRSTQIRFQRLQS